MKQIMLSILVAVLLGNCQTAARQEVERQAYCLNTLEWPSDISRTKIVKSEPPTGYQYGGVLRACLTVQIDESGNVTGVEVIRTDSSDFGSACVAALRRWHFESARRGSTPIAVTYHIFMRSMVQ
jgi:TonB family protein